MTAPVKTPSRASTASLEPLKGISEGLAGVRVLMALGVPVRPFNKPGQHSRGAGADGDPLNYSLTAPLYEGQPYKAFIRGRFLVLDIDRHPNKPDGLLSLYQWLETIGINRPDLPPYSQRIEAGSFPLYTQTPTGLHLFFSWKAATAATPKSWHLCPEVEIKTETIREGYNGSGQPRTLYYTNPPPPLVGLILDRILEKQGQQEASAPMVTNNQTRASYPKRQRQHTPQQWQQHLALTLETLVSELPAGLGHHEAQVIFSGKASRIYRSYTQKGFFSKAANFGYSTTLAYVQSRPDLFGTDRDTAQVVKSFFSKKE